MEDKKKNETIQYNANNLQSSTKTWMWNWNFFGAKIPQWKPTSPELLEEAEKRMLEVAGIEYTKTMVPIGDNIYLNTLKAGQGPPLVLVHGFGAGIGFWIGNLKELSGHYTVYAFDTIGFGRSSRPPFVGGTVKEADEYFLSSIEEWRKKVGLEKFTILGHSFGGYLSFLYALKHPQYVQHLMLADPWGVPERPTNGELGRNIPMIWRAVITITQFFNPLAAIRAAGPYGPGLISKFRGDIMAKFIHLYEDVSCVNQYIYHTNAQDPSGESAFHTLVQPFAWAKEPLSKRNIESLPEDIKVTLMYGERSWMDKNAGMELKNRLGSRAELFLIPNAGHHIYIDNSTYFNKLIIERKHR